MVAAKVLGQSTNADGVPIGVYDSNPIMNTRIYGVTFPDGAIQQYSANVIAESLNEILQMMKAADLNIWMKHLIIRNSSMRCPRVMAI